ncbi:MAG: ABC transporter ATP-binding protein [Symbiobacteriaceae bacterium]|nr:ABC transporter ATP-binding protein [Symbiobacteriaceae bacterium]
MLKLTQVAAGYGEADVIHDISFAMHAGESLCIVGPNGCGKTTLLRTIAGILPHRGEISLADHSLYNLSTREIASKIAMLGQITTIYFAYNVYETVMMGRYLHIKDRLWGTPSTEDKEVVLNCLEAVGMWQDRERDITKLSGGQLQRVFLARTMAQEPQIILLDEPTNHLDLRYQVELITWLQQWVSEGERALIGVLHDINMALRLSERLLVMQDGELQADGASREIVHSGLLQEIYGIDVAGYMRDSLRMWEITG